MADAESTSAGRGGRGRGARRGRGGRGRGSRGTNGSAQSGRAGRGGRGGSGAGQRLGGLNRKVPFPDYWSREQVDESLKLGKAIQGRVRISPKNYAQCFVQCPALSVNDVAVDGLEERNRALEGDIVVVELFEKSQWQILRKDAERSGVALPDKRDDPTTFPSLFVRPTGRIVYISDRKPVTLCVGVGKFPGPDGRKDWREGQGENDLVLARITDWPADSNFARGCIEHYLGHAGQIAGETQGILLENNIDTSDFPEEVLAELPSNEEGETFEVPAEELAQRRDMRQRRIFSIDPPTARDLDDALSCKELADGTFEIGVHIADVTYFLKQGSALDEIAARRATTTYLIQQVHPMLPRVLCENLCSLNANVDRLAFSVVWTLDADANILSEWFGRTVIRSCGKLSYGHAQEVIEGKVDSWPEEFPDIGGQHLEADVINDIRCLHKLAQTIRARRFANGALRLNKTKVSFRMGEDGLPESISSYVQRESNQLVEEFMLLANMAVARRVYSSFSGSTMLRRHPAPLPNKLDELIEMLHAAGVHVYGESAGDIQRSIEEYTAVAPPDRVAALQCMLSAPMQVARYFSTGEKEVHLEEYRHFALNVPFYTHFTSPIRRYADVVVHRQLQAALDGGDACYSGEAVALQANQCNERKHAAKNAQEASANLYLWVYIGEHGPLFETASVIKVQDRSFDFVVSRLGVEDRVNLERLEGLSGFTFVPEDGALLLEWKDHPGNPQRVRLFGEVAVKLSSKIDKQHKLCITSALVKPSPDQV